MSSFWRILLVMTFALLVLAVGCGDDDDDDGGSSATQAPSNTGAAETDEPTERPLTSVTVLLPNQAPVFYGYTIADDRGYYEEEGIDLKIEYASGGAEAVQFLIAGQGDFVHAPLGNFIEAFSQGHTDIRPIFSIFYGSLFYLTVPSDSDIEEAADLEGKTIGVSDLAGGEVNIVKGLLRTAGLDENDANIVAIGSATALTIRALEDGQVDAFAGSINDVASLQAQGLDLRYIVPVELASLPAAGIGANEDYINSNPEIVEGFLRATAKGYEFGQANPDAAIAILSRVTPEQFTDPTVGAAVVNAALPITRSPEGITFGFWDAESWGSFFDFIGAPRPEVELDTLIDTSFVEPANDYDHDALRQEAEGYSE